VNRHRPARPLRARSAAALVPAAAFLAAACASTGGATTPAATVDDGRSPRIVDGRTGAPVSEAAAMRRLADVPVVYVGERHDQPGDHAVQRRVVEGLLAAEAPQAVDPAGLAVGLEMVQRPFQPGLDEWTAGRADEAALLAAVEWDDRWGWDFAFYRPIFERVRDAGGRIVALNAPAEVTGAVGRGGLEALAPEDRAALPELDLDVAAHRAMIEEALTGPSPSSGDGAHQGDEGHPGLSPETLERFYTAQVIWDETMAETVAETLAAPDGPERMVVLAGRYHVVRGLGIPDRAARRGAGPYAIVLPVSAEELPDAVDADTPLADLLWVPPR